MKQNRGLDLLIVDYIQLISDTVTKEHGSNIRERVGYISRTLKRLAKELGVPILVAAQLNRELESRVSKVPLMSDIKECVTGDTLISYKGYCMTIKDIYDSNDYTLLLNYDTKTNLYRYTKPYTVLHTGIKDCIRIKTKDGKTLVLSKETLIYTTDGWIKAKDIKTGNKVAIDKSAS